MTSAIDEVLELAAPSTASTEANDSASAEANTNTPNSAADGSEGANSTTSEQSTDTANDPLYPNVLRTFKVGVDAPEDGSNPTDTLTIPEFAGYLSVENFKTATTAGQPLSPELIVKDANVYTLTKGKRFALPVVLVFPADSDEMSDAKVYLPIAEASEAYSKRPERGAGSASVSKRTQDDILADGAKKLIAVKAIENRLQRTIEQLGTATKQMDKYHGWLRPYFKDVAPVEIPATETEPARMQTVAEAVDAAVKDAFEAKAAELEEQVEAAKASDTPPA